MDEQTMPVIVERVEQAIRRIRGRRILLDADLATFYGVSTAALKRAVRRNSGRFPPDFMFELTRDESDAIARLRCQFGILKRGTHIKYLPYAIRQLMTPPDPPPKPIGFHVREPGVRYVTRIRRRSS